MTKLNMISGREAAMFAKLREFLAEQGISRKLVMKVQRNAEHALQKFRQKCSEEDVQLLQMISEPLRMEIHFELYAPILRAHPLFHLLEEESPAAVSMLCHGGVRTVVVSQGDVLFADCEKRHSPEMFFVTKGEMGYEHSQGSHHCDLTVSVCEGEWVAEPVLWCSWVHTGILTALCETELLAVAASSVCNCPLRDHTRSRIFARYAVEYVNTINTAPLTDLDNGTARDVKERCFGC